MSGKEKVTQSPVSKKRNRDSPETSPSQPVQQSKKMTSKQDLGKVDGDLNSRMMLGFQQLADKMDKLATKDDFRSLETKIEELVASKVDVAEQLNELRAENQELRSYIELVDTKARSANIVISGLKIGEEESIGACVEKLLVQVMNVPIEDFVIVDAYRLGPPGGRSAVLVKMSTERCVLNVLRRTAGLKGSTIRISRDMPPRVRDCSNRMLKLRHELKAVCPKLNVKLNRDKVIIENHRLEWRGDSLVCGKEDGVAVLMRTTGKDFAQVVEDIVKFRKDSARSGTSS
ncbi:Hypothetical protein NTJ_09033 [Nesidiocoris tenuis]|uniref:Uncharacterized protein n=1 Tax=Nesidiocoris tenuis TaxID=355587 RepID=A0ABN7AXY5_9HEMI|nr:Hypothetical protein NTJ_09033 [Nesidiocoris tenuis]